MTLRQWLDANRPGRGGLAWFVRRAESSYETVNRVLRGERIDDRKTAERLSVATGGAVSVADLMQIATPQQAPDGADSTPPPA
jgi:hypothetical protein